VSADPAGRHIAAADHSVELAERELEGRHEADSIREALRDAHEALRRARVGLGALAALERDEAREAESARG
jgi:hypothetical protein